MIKLIASDMDGTLLNNNHDIDKATAEAIKRAEDNGIIFAISTGRDYSGVKDILARHDLKCQCVLSNGAEYRDEEGKILNSINIKEETAKDIIRIMEENKLPSRIMTNKGTFTISSREDALKEAAYRTMTFNPGMTEEEAMEKTEKDDSFKNLKYVDDADKFFEDGIEIRKFVAFHKDIDLINRIKEVFSKMEGLAVSSSFYDNIEITDIGAQKGICLLETAENLGVKREEVMILGDSFNDYNMFEIFGETVAMKNAIPEIRAMAKYITDTNDNLGVAKAIDHVLSNSCDKMLKINVN